MYQVHVIAGSKSDSHIVEKVTKTLDDHGTSYKIDYLSAHRNPVELDYAVKNSSAQVFICIAGLSAALPGVVASKTTKPVIGVPVKSGPLNGMDALLSIVQMPKGVPVATVGIDNGVNAALLAIRILGLGVKTND